MAEEKEKNQASVHDQETEQPQQNPYGYGYGSYGYGHGNYGYGASKTPYGSYGSYGAYGPYGATYTGHSGNAAYGNAAYGNAAYGNGAYGNGAYGAGVYGNGQYGNAYYQPYGQQQQQDDEDSSSIDVRFWLFTILHYWYLFVVGAAIAFGASYLKNRRWMATYQSAGTIVIKESSPYGANQSTPLMRGFGLDYGAKNINNQVILLSSYDLLGRVVDSLPFIHTDYIMQGHFKSRNIYRMTPIIFEPTEVKGGYGQLFAVDIHADGTLRISSTDENSTFQLNTRYGEHFESSLFSGAILPTEHMLNEGRIYIRMHSRDELINEFMGRMQLAFVTDGSSVLQISFTSETADRDCDFINKLMEIYLVQNLESKNKVADASIRFIDMQLGILRESLEVSEGRMNNFRQENRFIDVSTYTGDLMAKMSTYDDQALNLRLQETYLDYLDNYLKTNMEQGAIVAPSSLGMGEGSLMGLVSQLNELNQQRAQVSEKNIYYAKFTRDIEQVTATIQEVTKSMRASLEIEKQDLKRRDDEVLANFAGLPEKELQMVAIECNYRIDDNYYTFFLQKRAEAEIQKASNMPDNEIMDRARTTQVTNGDTKKQTTSKYLIIGLIIPLLIIIISELLNNKVRTPKEAENLSDFRLIGSIRHARNQNPTLVKASPRSSYAEMLRSIRTRIEFIVQKKVGISIAITSTESGDGKTFLSTNLAALYGMTGKKVILVDCDIRKPNIHEKLGMPTGMGLSNYLIGDCTFEETLIDNTDFDFDIMRAGTIPPNPGELVRSEKLTELLVMLKEKYDYVIVDTSPVGLVPDGYAIIEQTDLTLFVVRCMQTNKQFCKSTLEQLAVDHRQKIHLILSDVPTDSTRYGYYSGGYGYGYGGYGYGYGYGTYGKGYGHGYGYGKGYGKGYGYGYGKYGKYGAKYGKYGKYSYPFHRRNKNNNYSYYSDDEA